MTSQPFIAIMNTIYLIKGAPTDTDIWPSLRHEIDASRVHFSELHHSNIISDKVRIL